MLSLYPSAVSVFASPLGHRPTTPLRRESLSQSPLTPRSNIQSISQPSPSPKINHHFKRQERVQGDMSLLSPLYTHQSHQQQQQQPRFFHTFKCSPSSLPYRSNPAQMNHIHNNYYSVNSILNDSKLISSSLNQTLFPQHLSPTPRNTSSSLAGGISPMKMCNLLAITPAAMKQRQLAISRVAFNQHRLRVAKELDKLNDADAPIAIIIVSNSASLKSVLRSKRGMDLKEASKHVTFTDTSSIATFSKDLPPNATRIPEVKPEPQSSSPANTDCVDHLDDNSIAVTPPMKPSARSGTPIPQFNLTSSPFTPSLNRTISAKCHVHLMTLPLPRTYSRSETNTPSSAWRDLRQPTPESSTVPGIAWVPPESPTTEQAKIRKPRDNKKKTSRPRSSGSPKRSEKNECGVKRTKTRKIARADEDGFDQSLKSSSKTQSNRNKVLEISKKAPSGISSISEADYSTDIQISNEGKEITTGFSATPL